MKISNDIFITNSNCAKIKSTYETSQMSNKMSKISQKESSKEALIENFFDYLINENSNYANFEKVTDYYEKKLHKNKNKYDLNLDIIKNKKEEIQKLNRNIYSIIIDSVKLEDKDMELYYDKAKEKLKKEIFLSEHELEVYKNTFSEIYKKNYLLSAELEEENIKEKIFEEQHEKYSNIKEAALNKIVHQQEKLKTLNYYFEKCQEINKDLLAKKQKKLKQLNYEIHVLKDDEAKNEETLNALLEKNNRINNFIQEKKAQYLIFEKDYNSYIKNYIKDRTNINQVYEAFNEKNIDIIINRYNKLKNENRELSNLFSLKSKKIINLNTTVTSMRKEYNFIIKKIKEKIKAEKEEAKNNIISHNEHIEEVNKLKNQAKFFILDRNELFTHNFDLLINVILSTLKLISIINHSRNISVNVYENLPYANRNHLIEKYQHYFDNNYIHKFNTNFESQFMNKKFIKFLLFLLKELNFQIKSIISNVYMILYQRQKEAKQNKIKDEMDLELLNSVSSNLNKNKIISEETNTNFISNFDINEYEKLYEEELKSKKKKFQERKKFFELEEKEMLKNKLKGTKKFKEDENTLILPSIERNLPNRINSSTDCISTKEFINQYYKYYSNSRSMNSINSVTSNSMGDNTRPYPIGLNKFNFIINYTNNFVSTQKEAEDRKIEKYQEILIKSKKIKEETEKKEIAKYIKRNKKIKKLLKEQYNKNISTDSEKDEKSKRDELALQIVTKELAELKKPKKFELHFQGKDNSKIFERYDDIRALELNFLKNKGNFFIDSNFFNEYYFKLKKQFNDNKLKAINLKNKNLLTNRNNINKKLSYSISMNNIKSTNNERTTSDKNRFDNNKRTFMKKMQMNSMYRNNSEVLSINSKSKMTTFSKKFI